MCEGGTDGISRSLQADCISHMHSSVTYLLSAQMARPTAHCNLDPMRYWRALPPTPPPSSRYITFELDSGGWNNVRMALESIFIIAHATNRTLVLPPPEDILYMSDVHVSHLLEVRGVDTISMDDFISRESTRLGLRAQEAQSLIGGLQHRPIHRLENDHPLWRRLRSRGHIPPWGASSPAGPNACLLLGAPSARADSAFCEGRPPFRPHEPWNQPWLLHLPCTRPPDRLGWYRLFGHFYTFAASPGDERINRQLRAMVRDGVRYSSPLMCTAESVVARLKRDCGGSFVSMHARQGDFQKTRPNEILRAADIARALANSEGRLRHGGGSGGVHGGAAQPTGAECLFIASDAPKSFFAPLLGGGAWRVIFLYDIEQARQSVPKALSGLVEQLVAAQGRAFYGTKLSTFSHYILRLRGYYNVSHLSWLLVPPDTQSRRPAGVEKLRAGKPVAPYWLQEWPLAWEFE